MKKIRTILFLLVFIIPTLSSAGTVATGATISSIGTATDGWSDNFYLRLSGGEGVCSNQTVIFKRERAINQDAFNRLYSMALTAFASSKIVKIYSYGNDNCSEVTFIEAYK